jgi:hypothetical protein
MSSGKKLKQNSTQSPSNGSSLFQPLFLTVALSCVAIAPFTFDAFTIPKLFVLYSGLLTVIVIALVKREKLQKLNPVPIWLIAILTLIVFTMAISTANSNTPLLRSMFGQFGRGNGLFYYYGVFVVLLIATMTYSKIFEPTFAKSMTYLSSALGTYALLQSVGIDFAKLDSKDLSVTVLTFGNSNFAGGMLAILFGYIFTRAFVAQGVNYRDLIISLVLLLALYKTAAVQGYLIVAFVILIVLPIRFVVTSKSRNLKLLLYAFWGFGALLVALGATGFGPLTRIFERPTFQMRIEYWIVGLRILKDNLLVGVGPDRLYDVTPSYMSPGSLQTITTTRMDSPHNWFISFGTSFGVIALLLLVLLFGLITFSYLRRMQLVRFLSDPSAPTFMAFLCVVIDALVSIEQPGLGIWLYFLGGKVLASVITNSSSKVISTSDPKVAKGISSSSIVLVCLIFATTASSYLITYRFVNDALLRSSIQNVMTSNPVDADLKRIESLTIKLRSEPEYVVQSVPILAKFGDGPALLNISKSFYDYNPQSIQATGIRAQVLKVVTSLESSCDLQVKLVANTPWQQDIVENYLQCLKLGFKDAYYRNQLAVVKNYLSISYPAISSIESSIESMLARAVGARLEFELGNLERAKSLKTMVERELQSFNASNPGNDPSKIIAMLNY